MAEHLANGLLFYNPYIYVCIYCIVLHLYIYYTFIIFFYELAPRQIQSISCDVREEAAKMLYHIVYNFLKVLLLTSAKVLGPND